MIYLKSTSYVAKSRFLETLGFESFVIQSSMYCKNSFDIYLYKEGPYTVRNKGDLDSDIKTKTSNLAL